MLASGLSGLKLTPLSTYTEDEDTAVDDSKKGAERAELRNNSFNIYKNIINVAENPSCAIMWPTYTIACISAEVSREELQKHSYMEELLLNEHRQM